ncbi:aquaporin-like isoform X2 [Photinus pyralis]|uniref:Aquaporin n=1 Tax=Photinus pyralis TaxID=7054 RepID=A0A1Y1L1A5_PHOPY|nr:aquaporin-like isoform X2 [Photinus pyralis]
MLLESTEMLTSYMDLGKQSTFFSQSVRKKNRAVCNIFVMGLAELLGTALLLFLGCMGCVSGVSVVPIPHHLSGIIFGMTVLLIIQLFGHISGAHLNPAVTLSSAILGHLKPLLVPVYIAAQFIGAFLGFGLLKVLIPEDLAEEFNGDVNGTAVPAVAKPGLCSTTLHPRLTSMQALAIEAIITTVLIMICCSVWDKRNAKNTDSTPVRFGLIISVISMTAGPFTGASMNTVRSFAPAVFNGDWDSHWVYWVGPTLGALIGTFSYKFLFEDSDDEEDSNEDKLNNTEDIPLHESHIRMKNNIV